MEELRGVVMALGLQEEAGFVIVVVAVLLPLGEGIISPCNNDDEGTTLGTLAFVNRERGLLFVFVAIEEKLLTVSLSATLLVLGGP